MESNLTKRIVELVNEAVEQQTAKPKGSKTVEFDSKTDKPWRATFSQRGFSIDGTRLSFELLDDAISKEYAITLDSGQGLVLDAVKMQKILKYRDLY